MAALNGGFVDCFLSRLVKRIRNENKEVGVMMLETTEMKVQREKKERIRERMESGYLMKVPETTVAYNVDDTSDEKPDINGINDWDEYWKHYTEEGN